MHFKGYVKTINIDSKAPEKILCLAKIPLQLSLSIMQLMSVNEAVEIKCVGYKEYKIGLIYSTVISRL